jgi:esterase
MQLNYKKVGEGTPLIILHGLFGSLDNWMGIAKTLGERFEVYLLDARNHGQSPHSDQFDYELMAEDLYEFIQEHQIVNPVVLGHSMGGKTAMQFAMNHTDILTKLVVADIAPKPYPVHHRQIIDGLLALDFDVIKTRQQADEELSKHIPDLSVRQFLLKNLYWKEKETLAWRFNLKAINQNIEIVGKALNNINPFLQPTLFIRGEKSNYILESDFEEIKHIFPNSEVKTIANSGHWIHAEQPQEFIRIVSAFLNL